MGTWNSYGIKAGRQVASFTKVKVLSSFVVLLLLSLGL